jgi:hypothetical protein
MDAIEDKKRRARPASNSDRDGPQEWKEQLFALIANGEVPIRNFLDVSDQWKAIPLFAEICHGICLFSREQRESLDSADASCRETIGGLPRALQREFELLVNTCSAELEEAQRTTENAVVSDMDAAEDSSRDDARKSRKRKAQLDDSDGLLEAFETWGCCRS